MAPTIHSHTFDNGLTLLAEPMTRSSRRRSRFCSRPAAATIRRGQSGRAAFACEMMLRGAGRRDSRALVDDLETWASSAANRSASPTPASAARRCAKNLPAALAIYADVLRRPHLPADQLEPARQVVLQELQAIEDEPSHKLMLELRRRQYPDPWGTPSQGDDAGARSDRRSTTCASTSSDCYRPNGTILGVAGNFDWQRLCDQRRRTVRRLEAAADVAEPAAGDAGARATTCRTNRTRRTSASPIQRSVSRSGLLSGLGRGRRA